MILYLASQSPRRSEILKKMKISFRVTSSAYHEKKIKTKFPADLVLRHALGKVRGAKLPPKARWVLGADTLVWASGKVLGKPRTEKEALQMLQLISGKHHDVFTGIALQDRKNKLCWIGCERTRVWVKSLTRTKMISYIRAVNSLDKAGAYAIQMKPKIVTRIEGSYSNVVGLPVELLKKILQVSNRDLIPVSLSLKQKRR